MSEAPKPRPSASLVLINSRNEILLVQRNPKARHFPSFHVFPGGNVDPEDGSSYAMTAIRETFEESGLLLASQSPPVSESSSSSLAHSLLGESALINSRNAITKRDTTFKEFLAKNNLTADIHRLLPFTQWITPAVAPTRYHTHFFITFLKSPSLDTTTNTKEQQFLPTPDRAQEVISTRFFHPLTLLSESKAGKISLMPPQFYIISALADILSGNVNTQVQRDHVTSLSSGPFGRMVFRPRFLSPPPKDIPEDHGVFVYDGDEAQGGRPGALHRAVFARTPRGLIPLAVHRTFDIFSEAECNAIIQESKL